MLGLYFQDKFSFRGKKERWSEGVGCLREERAGKVRDAFGSPQDVQTLSPKERQMNSKLPALSWA